MPKRPTVLLLFGSKVSRMPDVQEVTETVFGANGRSLKADATIDSEDDSGCESPELAALIPALLREIEALIVKVQPWKKPHRSTDSGKQPVTYEDIAGLLSALDKQADTRRDPVVQHCYEALRAAVGLSAADRRRGFGSLVVATSQWIKEVVHEQLTRNSVEPTALKEFLDRFRPRPDKTAIATTNHDLLIECVLGELGLPGNLGFVPTARSGVEVFRPRQLREAGGIKLLKLHGSVDWYADPEGEFRLIRSDAKRNPDHWDLGQIPEILVGTLNKLEDYSYSVYPHLLTEFQNTLCGTDRVLISGYGFRDSGINGRLIDWLERDEPRTMMIVHPDPVELRKGAHWAAADRLGDNRRVEFVEAKFEDATKVEHSRRIEAFLA